MNRYVRSYVKQLIITTPFQKCKKKCHVNTIIARKHGLMLKPLNFYINLMQRFIKKNEKFYYLLTNALLTLRTSQSPALQKFFFPNCKSKLQLDLGIICSMKVNCKTSTISCFFLIRKN